MDDLAVWLSAGLLAAAVGADLRLSPGYMRRVRTAVAAGDPAARTGMYRLTLLLAWPAAAVALALLLGGGLGLADVGFRLPAPGSIGRWSGLLAGAGVGLVVSAVVARRGAARVVGDVDVLIPRTAAERRWFAAVAVTAGITEEVVYRALALTVLLALLPGGRWPALVAAAVLFGLGHAYQGTAGVLLTAGLALGMGLLYLDTGSLLPGMALHAALDLRVLLLPVPSKEPGTA